MVLTNRSHIETLSSSFGPLEFYLLRKLGVETPRASRKSSKRRLSATKRIRNDTMEGTLCSQEGCRTCDFLPFTCKFCKKDYCLEHRSKFKHSCREGSDPMSTLEPANSASASASASAGPTGMSYSDRIAEVTSRHNGGAADGGLAEYGSQRAHHNVAASTLGDGEKTDERFASKLSGVEAKARAGEADGNTRKQNIGDKTRQMLLKKKAVGNTSIAVEDRFTVAVSFRATGQVQYVYFNRSTSLGEAMSSLGEAFTRAAYGTAARPDGMSLSVLSDVDADADVDSGSGSGDGYQGWDLRAPLSTLVPEFTELQVGPVRTTVVVARQSALEQDLLLRQALQGSPAKPSPVGSSSSASGSEPSVSMPLDRDYRKGDGVVYTGQDGTSFTAIVTGVHFDDPPDTVCYYVSCPHTHAHTHIPPTLSHHPYTLP